MKQGDIVLVWGATGGIGGYAVQYVLNGGGIPVGVVSSPGKAELLRDMGCDAVIDRAAGDYRSGRTRTRRTRANGGASARTCAGSSVKIPTSCSSIRAGRRWARRSSSRARWHRRDVRRDVRVHGRVRQPASLDEAEATHREPLRELPRGVGRKPAHRRGAIQPSFGRASAGRCGRSRLPGAQEPARGQDRRAVPRPREGLGIDDPELREKVGEDRITVFRRHA